eukprot:gene12649-12777_t
MGAVQSLLQAASRVVRNGPLHADVYSGCVPIRYIPQLRKPAWAPPAPLFGQMWAVLYGIMGGAHYLVTKETGTWLHWPYIIQLVLNLAWQPIFFLLKMPGVAQLENAALFAAVAYTTIDFWKVQPTAGKMMLPYLIFVGYANALNYNFWVNNQDVSAEVLD